MIESLEVIQQIFEQLKNSYIEEKTQKEELLIEVNTLKQLKIQQTQEIEGLHNQIKDMVENDLQKLNLSKDYEELQSQYNQAQIELKDSQQSLYQKDLLYKRQIYMLESENQEQRIQNEKQKNIISQMEKDVEEMFRKLTKTGYGELVQCNQTLLDRISVLDDEINKQNLSIEKLKQMHSEELSRQTFNYEILVQQYQTLFKENQNLIKLQSNSKNIYKPSGQNLDFDFETISPNTKNYDASTTAKKKRY